MSQPAANPFIEASKKTLLNRCEEELRRLGEPPATVVELDYAHAISLVAQLQLALRHPGNNGPGAEFSRLFIKTLIERLRQAEYSANAELAELGFDPAYDDERDVQPLTPSRDVPPKLEAVPPPPGLSERDLVAQSECVRLMLLLAEADTPHSKDLALIVGTRLAEIADHGAGDVLDASLIEPVLDIAHQLVAQADICPCDGPHCEGCFCCAHKSCEGGCVFATATLCSRCV